MELRRGDHSGARLQMERERLERECESGEEVIEHFQQWLKNPAVRDWICQNWATPEERERRIREIFGLRSKPFKEAATEDAQSNQVKPGQTTFPESPM